MKLSNTIKISCLGRIFAGLMLSGLLSLAPLSRATEGSWTTKADLPTPRWGLSTSVVDGKIYGIGGGQDPWAAYLSTVEEYDPVMDTWTRKADMPTGRAFLSTSVVDGKIYAVGGTRYANSESSILEEYDPATDTWTRKANMPTPRIHLSTYVVDGKIYAIGGWREPQNVAVATVEEYDPATDTWTRKADMPEARFALSTSLIEGKVYVIGGARGSSMSSGAVSTVHEYDPATDVWTARAKMPTARSYLSTCVVRGKIYAIGGTGTGILSPATVERYHPATNTWATMPDMPTARSLFSSGVVNGRVYSIGGTLEHWPWVPCSAVEEYNAGLIPADFNGDGNIDMKDLVALIECWSQNVPSIDIAPLPFGDGIVDVRDLGVLMSYWEQDVDGLMAHWALDQEAGDVAYDSIGECDAVLQGGPVWQPASGAVGGALEFDGIDDYVSTPFVLNPGDTSFTVTCWIKGGAPGQAIISQADVLIDVPGGPIVVERGSTWLGTGSLHGTLMTGLMGFDYGPLESESVITDDKWHHVCLVHDNAMLKRYLYVDGSEVAVDSGVVGGVKTAGGLHIGAGSDLDSTSFFSGLIDDVRIYDRAVKP